MNRNKGYTLTKNHTIWYSKVNITYLKAKPFPQASRILVLIFIDLAEPTKVRNIISNSKLGQFMS